MRPVPATSSPLPSGRVRLTLAGEDVELEHGARLGALRPRFAAVLGRTELLGATLEVGSRTLDDDALVGFDPLVPGADVRVHVARRRLASRDDDPVARARLALEAPARWEVVGGPGAGRVDTDVAHATGGLLVTAAGSGGVVGRRRRLVPSPGGRDVPAVPARGDDPGATTTRVHRARARFGRSRTTLARDHARRRPVQVRPAGRRVRHGDVLRAGTTTVRRVVVRAADDEATRAAEDATAGPSSRGRGLGPGLSVTTLVVPLVSASMLAVVTHRPALALVGLVGPLVLGVTVLVRRRRRTPPTVGAPPTTWAGLADAPVALTTRIVTGTEADRTAHGASSTGAPGAAPPSGPLGTAPPSGPHGGPLAHPSAGAAARPGDEGPRALAATGPAAAARARAAVLAFANVHPGASVTVVGAGSSDAEDWEWARWIGARPGDAPGSTPPGVRDAQGSTGRGARPGGAPRRASVVDDAPRLVVVLAGPGDLRRTSEWWAGTPRGTHVLLVTEHERPPAWCEKEVDGPGVDVALAHALARALAPRVAAAGSAHAATVPLADLLGLDTTSPADVLADEVAARWAHAPARPAAPVGRLTDGSGAPCVVDLVHDGPHGLVAGTTGAGKSELLQTLVLSLALTLPPERLQLVLIDHKGGAGFGPCLTLPHVAGVATDLEPGSAGRALAALRAELREREELLARHGVPDLDTLADRADVARPPRILVVVDELRALADDDPGLVPSFLRIAAQGRSLGLHLVLATQRPSGAVSADVRANVGLRVALRVASDADSRDVVDVPDAARLPASAPGLAVVVTSRTSHRTVRCALASAPSTPATADVRRVARTPGPARLTTMAWGEDAAQRLVTAAGAAVGLTGRARADALWAPPLPERCTVADTPAADAPGPGAPGPGAPDAEGHLPVALLDLPEERRRGTAVWDPARGHLHVEGAPGSGRSTLLRALALEAADRGQHVHVLGPDPLVLGPDPRDDSSDPFGTGPDPLVTGPDADRGGPPWLGTHVSATDPRRAHALLARLLAVPPEVPTLVLVDGVEEITAALGRVARGAGADTLVALARQPAVHGVRLALASSRSLPGPLAATLGPRLVLSGSDRTGDLARGIPSALAGLGGAPGRGVWTGAGPARLAQVFVPVPGLPRPPVTASRTARAVPRLRPVPTTQDARSLALLEAAARAAAHPGLAPLGHGGDDAGPRLLDVTRDVLVAGPPGSGRSTALARLARRAARLGPVLVVGSCQGLGDDVLAGATVVPMTPDGLAEVPGIVEGGGWTLVVDDVDVLARLLPAEHDRVAAVPGIERCLVSATTSAAAMASRGLLARVRAGRHGVLLDPGRPGAADVFATEVADVVEPGPCPPGRGALVVDGRAELVQCLAPDVVVRDAQAAPHPS